MVQEDVASSLRCSSGVVQEDVASSLRCSGGVVQEDVASSLRCSGEWPRRMWPHPEVQRWSGPGGCGPIPEV